ncbi:DUF1956 domain-containing protein [Paracoccus aurantiacus]|uniref:DUF1956 domain-containing protein n=1 Tax=Paracoccus aurantiacus TaxID=2599412 RepID=A0A5C6S1K8_9RHOB|nr:TetR/AcrR family transcriptional regulator [Paracoccus aurantiacus]TXB68442.1 DUF1956 domain-containing protein [Paracoccus aurantiacus]
MTKTPRPQRADGEATRNRILNAAGTMIAAAGFADTTNKSVAARADVDMASINYHFGNRSGLYQATLIEAHRRIIDIGDLETLTNADMPAQEKLRRVISFFVATARAEENWPVTVLLRELLSPSPHIEVLRQSEVAPKLMLVMPIISQITEIPVGDPVLWRCLPCIGAPCLALLLAGTRRSIFDVPALNAPAEELADHLYIYALGGLNAIAREYAEKVSETEKGVGETRQRP